MKFAFAVCVICAAAVFFAPCKGISQETPESIAAKVAAFKKEYPPFNYNKARGDAEKAYPFAKIGDEVEIRTTKGTLRGKFSGLQGDKLRIGPNLVFTSEIDELDKSVVDPALCKRNRDDFVEKKFTEYMAEKDRAVEKFHSSLAVKPHEPQPPPANGAQPPRQENNGKPAEPPKDSKTPPAEAKPPANNSGNAAPEAKPAAEAAKPAQKKNEPPSSIPAVLMPYSPVNLVILFLWFLSGLYALKVGETIFRKSMSNQPAIYDAAVGNSQPETFNFHPYYNLLSIFLGPVVLLLNYVGFEGADFLKNILSRKPKKAKSNEPQITIIDSKGVNAATMESHEGLAFLKHLLFDALLKGASDIFIDPKNENYTVRMRVDGLIKVVNTLEEDKALSLINMIKVAAGMDIAEKRRPQDGSFSANTETNKASFRVASVGVFGGEKITLRVISSDKGKYKLESIGFTKEQYDIVASTIKLPSGMVLVCGPTGSGKTTTLYSMLGDIDYNMKNVISIEDPVEYVMPNISQMEVNVKAGITFASLLRNSLRQNPDIIFVGEIRDEETAQIAVNASQTGHLIVATIHSSDNVGTIDRLMNLGIPLRSIAATLHVVISQRLVRKLCKHCKTKATLTAEQRALLDSCGLSGDNICAPGKCAKCNGTGYAGRRAVFEILLMDAGLRAALEEPDASNTSIRDYIEKNHTMTNIAGEVLTLVCDGVTSYEEFDRVTLNI